MGQPEDAARLVAFLAGEESAPTRAKPSTPREAFFVLATLPETVGYYTRIMKPSRKFLKSRPKLLRRPARTLFSNSEDELHAYVRGPLYPRPILYALLALFGMSAMLTMDWFGLLLLNSEGVILRMGTLNVLRVTAVLMGGIAVSSILLVPHYKRLYTYTSDENVFFTLTFTLSFLLGSPCALVGIFG